MVEEPGEVDDETAPADTPDESQDVESPDAVQPADTDEGTAQSGELAEPGV